MQNITRIKVMDSLNTALTTFMQVGVGSLVLWFYYAYVQRDSNKVGINNLTLIYLFQILTASMNGVSWNLEGIRGSKVAANGLHCHGSE